MDFQDISSVPATDRGSLRGAACQGAQIEDCEKERIFRSSGLERSGLRPIAKRV
ncbi:hypothetical protein [Porphyromonas sp.]